MNPPLQSANAPPADFQPASDLGGGTAGAGSSNPYGSCTQSARNIAAAVGELERHSRLLRLDPLAGREWYEVLFRKLLPQLGEDPFIVVAVVGGTNIGKSVIFNHLAGGRVSATSPLASGTKHPVCLIPNGFEDRHSLAEIFQGFELHPWTNSNTALENHAEHRLFWQTSPQSPANLLILDTPDIDSDAPVNWLRAEHILHCADVLIAVLTQQKYNDAAVKQFFRKAAAEDKAVVVVFNQCLLPEDEAYWPLWLTTFTRETGIAPEFVYLAPNDRRAAEGNRLPFYLRFWNAEANSSPAATNTPASKIPGDERPASAADAQTHNLRDDLSQLRFAEIKIRTLRGSLNQILDPRAGIPAYLDEIQQRSADFEGAYTLLNSRELARVQNWPPLPNRVLVQEIRHWWRMQRVGVTRSIHDFYNTVTTGVTAPFLWAKEKLSGPVADPLEEYRTQERNVLLAAIERLYEGLTHLSQLGNELLRPRLVQLLGGKERSQLIEQILLAHGELRLDEEIRDVVCTQMQSFREESPQIYEFLKRLDSIAAMVRPVTSAVLLVAGGGPIGDVMAPMAHEAAAQVVLHIATGTGAVIAGETAISSTTGGLRTLEAKFRQLQNAFTAHRITWFAGQLQTRLLGSLQEDLRTAAELPKSPQFHQVQTCLQILRTQLSEIRG